MKKHTHEFHLQIDGFDGPLSLLYHLVQQKEVDIFDLRLKRVVDVFLQEFVSRDLDKSSEFVGIFSSLLLYKSKFLLPAPEKIEEVAKETLDEDFNIIHQLIDYCLFKEAGKKLVTREEIQQGFFQRGKEDVEEMPRSLGIDHLSLDDLAKVFKELLHNKEKNTKILYEEEWKVSDKVKFIKFEIAQKKQVPFTNFFLPESSKLEWIVTFLAMLELMKNGLLAIRRDEERDLLIVLEKI